MANKITDREFWDTLMRLLKALRDAYNQSMQGEGELPGRVEEAAIPAMLMALSSADESLRRGAAWVLGTTRELILASQTGQVIPMLIEALKHPDAGVQRAAIRTLGWIGDGTAVTSLIGLLNTNGDPTVRREVAEALGKLAHPSTISDLIRATEDAQESVRYTSAWALGRIGDRQAIAPLSKRLKDDSRRVRRAAARALGWIGDETAVPALLGILHDESSGVRRDAARALGKIGSPAGVSGLVDILDDLRPVVRCAAAEALGSIGDPSGAPALLGKLDDEDHAVRRAAARALGSISDPRAMSALLESLRGAQNTGGESETDTLGTLLYEALTASLPVEAQEVGMPASRYLDPVTTVSRSIEALLGDARPQPAPAAQAASEEQKQSGSSFRLKTVPGKQTPGAIKADAGSAPASLTAPGVSIPIGTPLAVIGRSRGEDGQAPDVDLRQYDIEYIGTVSRRHCQITRSEDQYYLEDLGSRNGTFINREKLEPGRKYRLRDGDNVLVGRVALTFKA